eukprot:272111_1
MDYLYFIPSLICIPIAIYHNFQLNKEKDQMYMYKRQKSIVFGLNTTTILAMCDCVILRISRLSSQNMSPMQVSIMLFLVLWFIFIFVQNVKNWMIYYKYKWTYYTLEYKWQQIINTNIAQKYNQTNWYIRNNMKYGKLSYIYKLFALFHLIAFFSCATGMFLRTNSNSTYSPLFIGSFLLSMISLLFPIIFFAIIVFNTRNFNDTFFIHWENKIRAKILILLILSFIATVIITSNDAYIGTGIANVAVVPILFALNYVSTIMIIKKNASNSNIKSTNRNKNKKERKDSVQLEQILSNEQSLHMFMIHLSKEWSMECLLSLIEFHQFEKYLIKKMFEMEYNNLDIPKIKCIDFPENIPNSLIVEMVENDSKNNSDTEFCAKMKAHKLYEKYILTGSEFEINISGVMKQSIDILENKQLLIECNIHLKDLILLFEPIKHEMIQLLQFSFFRFKQKEEYSQIKQIFAPDNVDHLSFAIEVISSSNEIDVVSQTY